MSQSDKQLRRYQKRLFFPIVLILIAFTIIATRLWSLQVIDGDEYKTRADNNRVRSIKTAPPRGRIIDRNGQEIVTSRATYSVVWVRSSNNIDNVWLKKVSAVLALPPSAIMDKIRQQDHKPRYIPIKLMDDVSWEIVTRVETSHHQVQGLEILVTPQRQYHLGNFASHVLGYLGTINKKELLDTPKFAYHHGAQVGKIGIERLREEELRGEPGESFSEVNARGYKQRSLGGVSPLPGNELRLTIDVEMQKAAEHIMSQEGRSGAVVAMDPNSGRILTLVSSPVLPLNDFVGGISHKAWNSLLDNPLRPLVNKAVQGQYPPASTYKLITAIAGLAEGIITPERIIHCPGHYQCGSRTFHCWKRSGHGDVNLKKALAESCDVYFYQVGQELGVNTLARYARMIRTDVWPW